MKISSGSSQQKLVDVDDRDGPEPEHEFTCTCSHTNRDHKKRRGDGPYYCSKCGCKAFTWNGDESERVG